MRSWWIPARVRDWRERRHALLELAALQLEDDRKLALDGANLVHRAKVALGLGEQAEARNLWQGALLRYPHFARASPDALPVLLGMESFDEAEALMLDRRRRDPGRPVHWCGHALVAERRGDIQEATRRWQDVRRKFPEEPMGYVQGGIFLRNAEQTEAADALLGMACDRFPHLLEAWVEWARTAERRHAWPDAMARWEAVRRQFRHAGSEIGIALALEKLGRIAEAEDHLNAALLRLPLNHEIPIALARLAELRGDREAAVLRWAFTQGRFPLLPFGYRGGARVLMEMGRLPDAEAILLKAIDRFPADAWPEVAYASIEESRRDWSASASRWSSIRTRWPDQKVGYLRGIQALAQLGRQDEAARLRQEMQHRFSP